MTQGTHDVSELCTRCGLCCVVLRATCELEQAQALAECADIDVLRVRDGAAPHMEVDPPEHVVMRFPCTFLRGRVMKAVRCAAYEGPRPPVCGSYICKVASKYALREITLDEGLSLLDLALIQNDATIFNWMGTESEAKLATRHVIQKRIESLRAEGVAEGLAQYLVAAAMVPKYGFASQPDLDLMCMHLSNYDDREQRRGEAEYDPIDEGALPLYCDESFIHELDSVRERSIASTAIRSVLKELRTLFKKEDS